MRDVPGYEGLYAVTSCGRVWSYKKQRFLKPWNNGHGYQMVWLYNNHKAKGFRVHRLVAEAYIPNPEGKPQVDHINHDKKANYVNNLRWATGSENVKNGYKHRESYYSPVLCVELDKAFDTMREAAEFAGIHRQGITNCVAGKQKSAGGYHWERIEKD